ncbi:hypothetical protein V6Z12_A06G036800 [Gossypium hirsutum]
MRIICREAEFSKPDRLAKIKLLNANWDRCIELEALRVLSISDIIS